MLRFISVVMYIADLHSPPLPTVHLQVYEAKEVNNKTIFASVVLERNWKHAMSLIHFTLWNDCKTYFMYKWLHTRELDNIIQKKC